MRAMPLLSMTSMLTVAAAAQVSWLPQAHLTPRWGHAMAFDPVRKQVLLFGGSPGGNDLWGWDGSSWSELPATNRPPARSHAAIAFDARRGRLVVFGGIRSDGYLADTWEWDGRVWRRATPTTHPSPRSGAKMVFDPNTGRVRLFGGMIIQNYQGVYYSDLWEWDGRRWTQIRVAGGPSARADHAMAFDAARGRTIVRGGWNSSSSDLKDTWEFDGTRWYERQTATRPLVLRGAAAWFDPETRRTMLFGYFFVPRSTIQPRQETWALDATGWTRVEAHAGSRQFLYLAHDPIRKRTVRFDGATSEFDGARWRQVQPAENPGRSFGQTQAVAFDSRRAVTVLVQSHGRGVLTWEHDGRSWTKRGDAGGPVISSGHAIAFDARRNRVVLFGGRSPYGNNQTWEYDGVRWTRMQPSVRPPWMDDPAITYDHERGEVVLIGASASGRAGATWTWDGLNWTNKTPTVAPFGRIHARAVWHPGRKTVVLYGGGEWRYVNTIFGDLWEWDGKSWTKLANTTPAGTRSAHQMAYDRARDRLVVFGGRRGNNWLTDTWEWGPAGWTQRTTATTPGRSSAFAMTFDAARDRTVLFGGETITTWTYGPDAPATTLAFGPACRGSAGTPALEAENRPWIGDEFREALTNLPPRGPCLLMIGISNRAWGSLRLPFDLTPLGMNGCSLLTSIDLSAALVADASGTARRNVRIPPFAGAVIYHQALVLDGAANRFGATTSNGLEIRFGDR